MIHKLTSTVFLLAAICGSANALPTRDEARELTAASFARGTVRHIVIFKFRSDVPESTVREVERRFLNLKHECLRNGLPYIVSVESGTANSHEGADQGMQLGFIVTFKSQGDRNYYVGQPLIDARFTDLYDPAHVEFKNFVGPLLATPAVPNGVFVFDFTVEGRG